MVAECPPSLCPALATLVARVGGMAFVDDRSNGSPLSDCSLGAWLSAHAAQSEAISSAKEATSSSTATLFLALGEWINEQDDNLEEDWDDDDDDEDEYGYGNIQHRRQRSSRTAALESSNMFGSRSFAPDEGGIDAGVSFLPGDDAGADMDTDGGRRTTRRRRSLTGGRRRDERRGRRGRGLSAAAARNSRASRPLGGGDSPGGRDQ